MFGSCFTAVFDIFFLTFQKFVADVSEGPFELGPSIFSGFFIYPNGPQFLVQLACFCEGPPSVLEFLEFRRSGIAVFKVTTFLLRS